MKTDSLTKSVISEFRKKFKPGSLYDGEVNCDARDLEQFLLDTIQKVREEERKFYVKSKKILGRQIWGFGYKEGEWDKILKYHKKLLFLKDSPKKEGEKC